MPADTAYLEGGPCNGTTHKISGVEGVTGQIVCKGGLYTNLGTNEKHKGDLVFKYQGTAPAVEGGTTTISTPRAHKGWADLQTSLNRNWPHALNKSERLTRASLRSLQRTHKVKG